MKIRVHTVVLDGGDGSSYTRYFKSTADVEKFINDYENEKDSDDYGWDSCVQPDNVSYEDFVVEDYEVVG